MLALELPTVRCTFPGALPPLAMCGVTSTYKEDFAPCGTELGTCLKASDSVGAAGGGGGGVVLFVGVGVGSAFVGDEDGDPGEVRGVGDGDVVVVDASAADAVLLARTTPVPTVMISGFRTDRASTAYNLLNDRLCY
jgi:hypothetical protein